MLIKQVPAPTGANQIQGVELPGLFTDVQQQEAGAPNPQVQVSLPVSNLLYCIPLKNIAVFQ